MELIYFLSPPLFNWSQNLFFRGQNSHFLILIPCAPCRLATCLVRRLGQVEHEVKAEAGDMSWLREPTSRSVVYLWGTGSLFPLGLELEALAYNPLEIPHQKERCLEKNTLNPDGCVESLGRAVPTHYLLCYKSQQMPCLMKASFDWGFLFKEVLTMIGHTFEFSFLTANIKRKTWWVTQFAMSTRRN